MEALAHPAADAVAASGQVGEVVAARRIDRIDEFGLDDLRAGQNRDDAQGACRDAGNLNGGRRDRSIRARKLAGRDKDISGKRSVYPTLIER